MRSKVFKLIVSKKNKEIIQNRGITLNFDGCRNGMFDGSNGLFGYDQEIVDEVENMQFYKRRN